jgi:rhodanese-related sulfurtransferase
MTTLIRSTLVLLLGGVIAVAGCSSPSSAQLETVPALTAAEVIADTPDVVVLDIRTPEELQSGFISGAINIDFYEPDFAAKLDLLAKDTPYVVYCRSGNRSGQAMGVFADLGFSEVTEIDGGIVEWTAQGLPVVTK